jgi:hypothetical protein
MKESLCDVAGGLRGAAGAAAERAAVRKQCQEAQHCIDRACYKAALTVVENCRGSGSGARRYHKDLLGLLMHICEHMHISSRSNSSSVGVSDGGSSTAPRLLPLDGLDIIAERYLTAPRQSTWEVASVPASASTSASASASASISRSDFPSGVPSDPARGDVVALDPSGALAAVSWRRSVFSQHPNSVRLYDVQGSISGSVGSLLDCICLQGMHCGSGGGRAMDVDGHGHGHTHGHTAVSYTVAADDSFERVCALAFPSSTADYLLICTTLGASTEVG